MDPLHSGTCRAGKAPDHVPRLMQQLTIIKNLCDVLFAAKVSAIDAALEAEYQHPSETSRAVACAQEYDADRVPEQYWKPVLNEIAESIQ